METSKSLDSKSRRSHDCFEELYFCRRRALFTVPGRGSSSSSLILGGSTWVPPLTRPSALPFSNFTFCRTSWQAFLATSGSITKVSSPTPSEMTSRGGLTPRVLSLLLGLRDCWWWPAEGEDGDEVLDVEETEVLRCSSSTWAGEGSTSASPMANPTRATAWERIQVGWLFRKSELPLSSGQSSDYVNSPTLPRII